MIPVIRKTALGKKLVLGSRLVRSFIDGGKADKVTVERAVSRLVKEGHVAIDEKGAVTMGR